MAQTHWHQRSKERTHWVAAALPLLVIAVVLVAAPLAWPAGRPWAYLAVLLLFVVELVVIGLLMNGRMIGVFIDNRCRLSLSKLQAGAWTVVVLAAFATIAAFNAGVAKTDPAVAASLGLQIPTDVLLAMGLSATSLVATPGLLSLKSQENPAAGAKQAATDRMNTPVSAVGKLFTKPSPKDASWADLFTGDELGNAGFADLGKVQQALITLVLLGAYAGYVFALLASPAKTIAALPGIDKSFVWLLGVSHAAYLAYKAAPHTETGDAP